VGTHGLGGNLVNHPYIYCDLKVKNLLDFGGDLDHYPSWQRFVLPQIL